MTRSVETPPSGSRQARALRALASLAVLVIAILFTYRAVDDIGWSALAGRLASLHATWLAAITLVLALRFVAVERRWSILLERLRPLPAPLHRMSMVMSGVFVNHVTPTLRLAGGLLRSRYAARPQGPDAATVYGSVLLDQAAHHLVAGVLTWLALIAAALLTGHRAVAAVASSLLVLAAALVYLRRRQWLGPAAAPPPAGVPPPVARAARLLAAGRRALGSFRQLLSERSVRWRLMTLTVAFVAGNVAAQWLVFRALGGSPPLVGVAVAVLLGTAAGALAGTPGGVGSTEAVMIAGYGALGVAADEAVAGTLAFRGLHYALVLLTGPPALAYCELRRRRERRAAAAGAAVGGGGRTTA